MSWLARYSADDRVGYNGMYMKIKDIPDPYVRAGLGVGHWPNHGRPVVELEDREFPLTPDTCLVDIYGGEWIKMGECDACETLNYCCERLVCTGCGLDCT